MCGISNDGKRTACAEGSVSIKAYDRDASFKEIYETYQRDGAVIVHNLLSKEEIQSFRDEVKGTLKTTDAGPKSSCNKSYSTFWGDNTIRFSQLASRSKTFLNKYLVHPLVIQMADAELVPNEYWLNTGEMMCIGPNSKPQELHRDAKSWPKMCESRESDPVEIAFMLAVDDFTEETGATCVVPGSQDWDDFSRTPKSCEVVQAAMPAGSVLIYSGKVVHGGGPNSTKNRWREGCHLSFVSRWLVPEEAGCLSISKEEAQHMSPLQLSLLGWTAYFGYEGDKLWTLDSDDPAISLLDDPMISLQEKFYEKYSTDDEWADGFTVEDCPSVYTSGMTSLDEYMDSELDYKKRKSLKRKLKKAGYTQTKGFDDEDVGTMRDLLTAHWAHYGRWDGCEDYCMEMFKEMKGNVIMIRNEDGLPVGIVQYCHGNVKLAHGKQFHHFAGLWAVQRPRSGAWHSMMTALIEKAIELKCDIVSLGNNMHEQKRRNFGSVNFEINYQRLTSEPLPPASAPRSQSGIVDLWDDTVWDDLPSEQKAAAVTLGFSKDTWDDDQPSPWDDEDWCDLPEQVMKAAKKLGYSMSTWDDDD